MSQDSILSFYSSLLATAGCTVDSEDRVFFQIGDEKPQPLTVGGKHLLIPTESALRSYDKETQAFFHPLSENIQRGESDVFKVFKRHVTTRIINAMSGLGVALLTLQMRPDIQRNMNQDQMELMLRLASADAKALSSFQLMVFRSIGENPDRLDQWALSFYPKRNGTFEGTVHRRVTVTSFPTYNHIKAGGKITKGAGKDEKDIYRKQDYATYIEVMETLFPDLIMLKANGVTEDYNAPGDASVAPILTSFLRAVAKVATRLNDVTETLGALLDAPTRAAVTIPLEWEDTVRHESRDALIRLQRRVPTLSGNDGDVETEDAIPTAPRAEVPRPAAPVAPPPVRRDPPPPPREERHDERSRAPSIASFVSPLAQRTAGQPEPVRRDERDEEAERRAQADRQARESAAQLERERREAERRQELETRRRREEDEYQARRDAERRAQDDARDRISSGSATMKDLLNTRADVDEDRYRDRDRYDRDDRGRDRYRDDRSRGGAYPGSRDRYRGSDSRYERDDRERDRYRDDRYRDDRDRDDRYSRGGGGYRDDRYRGGRDRY